MGLWQQADGQLTEYTADGRYGPPDAPVGSYRAVDSRTLLLTSDAMPGMEIAMKYELDGPRLTLRVADVKGLSEVPEQLREPIELSRVEGH